MGQSLVTNVDAVIEVVQPSLDVLGAPILKVFQPLYDFNNQLSNTLGFPPDATIYLMNLAFSLVLGLIYRLIPRNWITFKHLYNSFWGVYMVSICFGWAIINPLLITVISYLMLRILPPNISSKVTIVVVFVYCFLCQLYEYNKHFLEWKGDFTGVQMIATFKFASVPFNLLDGMRVKNNQKVHKEHEKRSLSKPPSPLEYFSYIFFFATVNQGPFVEFKHYLKFVENPKIKKKDIPFDGMGVLTRLGWAVGCLATMAILGTYGVSPDLIKPNTGIIGKSSLVFIVFLTVFLIFVLRLKYYIVWFFAESTCVLCGLGYTGIHPKTAKHTWKDVQTGNIVGVETALSIRTLINSWNISVSKWLRYYVYMRLPFKSKTVLNLFTFTVSAFWHGVYPGYYVMWTSLVFLNMVYVFMYKKIRPRVVKEGSKVSLPLKMVLALLVHITGSHFTVPFVLLAFDDCKVYYKNFYWMGHVILLAIFVILAVIPPPRRKKKEEEKPETEKVGKE